MIKPTVGRIVWYWDRMGSRQEQPQGAMIAYVHSDRLVNLDVTQPSGEKIAVQSVTLWQGDLESDAWPASAFCCWMPYQRGQAAKTENLEQQLATGEMNTLKGPHP